MNGVMHVAELGERNWEGHRFQSLLSNPDACLDAVGAVAEAVRATLDVMHPGLGGDVKGSHTYSRAWSHLGYALERHGGRLQKVDGQQRIVFDHPEGAGQLSVALTRGVRAENGFDVNEKGRATESLIAPAQFSLELDLPDVPLDAGAFFVYTLIGRLEGEGDLDVVVYLAHPAELDEKRRFLYCDECIRLGRLPVRRATPTTPAQEELPVQVVPKIGVREA